MNDTNYLLDNSKKDIQHSYHQKTKMVFYKTSKKIKFSAILRFENLKPFRYKIIDFVSDLNNVFQQNVASSMALFY